MNLENIVNDYINNKLLDVEELKLSDTSKNKSALITCLSNNALDEELFKSWVAREMNLRTDDERVDAKVKFIVGLFQKLLSIKNKEEKLLACEFLARLTSSKFSGKKQSELAISLALDKLIYCFINQRPIVFIFGFGGYKNYNSPSFPEVDFAELYHMKFMFSYLYPLVKKYKYGIIFEYESEEISIQFNNVPQITTDRYTKTFKRLLDCFCENVARNFNVNFDFVIARDMYAPDDLYLKMKEYYPEMEKVYNSLSAEEQLTWYKRAETNFLVKGTEDFSNLSEKELSEKIISARITNECFLMADYDLRVNFWERPNAISLYGTWGKTPCASPTDAGLHLKATASSNTDFWIGTGILEIRDENNVVERILSRKQYEEVKDKLVDVKVESPLKSICKNFDHIQVYEGKLNF